MPKVSIIMPLYNSAAYLKEAIDSIINQTLQDWEFIIINEFGSEDGSREIAEQYAEIDSRFIILQNDTRLGISASMNRGLDAASGEYIARMDADDISLPSRFAKQTAYLDAHPEIAMCGVKVEIFGSNPFEWELETKPEKIATNILFYSPSVHPTVMIRRSFLMENKIRYNDSYRASEDYDLFSQICQKGSAANLEEILFRYRIMTNNATFKNNDIGMVIYNEVMDRQFQRLGLTFTKEELCLLSPHYSVKNLSGVEVLKAIDHLALLLQKIFIANEACQNYDRQALWGTLHKRFKEAYDSTEWFCRDYDRHKLEQIYSHSIFSRSEFYQRNFQPYTKVSNSPKVTVLIPTYNSEDHILATLWSILKQSFQDFEILIINEFGSNDNTVFICKLFQDGRIRVIQNSVRLGLAESLNLGIREAKGEYIARMDADDLSHRDRLKLQTEFLDSHPDYGICGSWQHHFGVQTEWIHQCSVTSEDIEAELIFNCDLCHSTLMLRREAFLKNDLFFDSSRAAEDYELWTRAVKKFKIGNLPLILGEYRVGETNITAGKMERLSAESGELAAKNIKYYFGFDIEKEMIPFQSGWENKFAQLSPDERGKRLKAEKAILKRMWEKNQTTGVLNSDSLLKTINKRWRSITNTQNDDGVIYSINELFDKFDYNHITAPRTAAKIQNFSPKQLVKSLLRRPYHAVRRRTVAVLQQAIWDLDGHLYDYYSKLLQTSFDLDGHLYDYYERLDKHSVEQVQNLHLEHKSHESSLESIEKALSSIGQNLAQLQIRLDQIEAANSNYNRLTDTMEEQLQQICIKTEAQLEETIRTINEATDGRIWKAEQQINEITDGRIWKAEQNLLESQEFLATLLLEFQTQKNKAILLNTPSHDNLGDHAIALAEKYWLADHTDYHVIEIPGETYRKFQAIIRNFIHEEDLILLSGGGYLGTLWAYEEALAEQVISDFPQNQIIIFPQSIYFSKDSAGAEALKQAQDIFSRHRRLTICVREPISFAFAKENFSSCRLVSTTDIALYLFKRIPELITPPSVRDRILLCLKSDKESALSPVDRAFIKEYAQQAGGNLCETDTVTGYPVEPSMRYRELSRKLQEFSEASLVITDRLHGIIFSALTHTPCIALGGVSYKNKGICEYLSAIGQIFYADTPEKLPDLKAFSSSSARVPVSEAEIMKAFESMNKLFP